MPYQLPSRQRCLALLRPISVANLPDGSTGKATCNICFGDLADKAEPGASERAVRLHGTHVFGERCIRKWLEQNNSCPNCRRKVHAGADEDHRRLVNSLTAQTRLMMQQSPAPESPVVDRDVFKLFERLGRGGMAVDSDLLRDQLETRTRALFQWRAKLWERNPSCLKLSGFAPYTRTQALRAQDLDVQIEVHEERILYLLEAAAHEGFLWGIINTMRRLPVHVGSHPLSSSMEVAIRRQVRKDRGHRVTVSTLAVRLLNKLDSGLTKGVMNGEREDLPRGFNLFWEDVIVRVLRKLIIISQRNLL
ncbi:hypothetical protein MBLNU13_g09795t1 [Cladosporium sp. NU13]